MPGNAAALVQFENPLATIIQEVTIVRDGDDGSFVIVQVTLKPRDGLGVQVVCWFIQQQHIGMLQQGFAQRHSTLFTAGQWSDL